MVCSSLIEPTLLGRTKAKEGFRLDYGGYQADTIRHIWDLGIYLG